jgi:hypothetical protein
MGNSECSFFICLDKSIPSSLYISIIHRSNIFRLVKNILDASINDLQITILIFQSIKYCVNKDDKFDVKTMNNIFLSFNDIECRLSLLY